MSEWQTGSILMTHDVGLHARPSVKLTKLAKGYSSEVEIAAAPEGPWIDAKSIVKVMALKAKRDTIMHVRARGTDARNAVSALLALIEHDFDDDHANAVTG
jgi:phosphocarrier protein